jgi:hypothetical protein
MKTKLFNGFLLLFYSLFLFIVIGQTYVSHKFSSRIEANISLEKNKHLEFTNIAVKDLSQLILENRTGKNEIDEQFLHEMIDTILSSQFYDSNSVKIDEFLQSKMYGIPKSKIPEIKAEILKQRDDVYAYTVRIINLQEEYKKRLDDPWEKFWLGVLGKPDINLSEDKFRRKANEKN